MTTNEFMTKILEVLPNAWLGEDLDGELIIHTGLIEKEDGELVELEPNPETDQ